MRRKTFWLATTGLTLLTAGIGGFAVVTTQFLPEQQISMTRTETEVGVVKQDTPAFKSLHIPPGKRATEGSVSAATGRQSTAPLDKIGANAGQGNEKAKGARIIAEEFSGAVPLEDKKPAKKPKVYSGGLSEPEKRALEEADRTASNVKPAFDLNTIFDPSQPQALAGRPQPKALVAQPSQLPVTANPLIARPVPDDGQAVVMDASGENYGRLVDNPVTHVADNPVSTFSIDVDTGAYANMRRFLGQGQLPPMDSVRVEEMVNYFDYAYPVPERLDRPFNVTTHLAPTPWNLDTHLLRVAVKAFEVPEKSRPAANLVFLLDVSGSMNSPDKLPLLKNAFHILTSKLTDRDRVSIVVYAGAAGVVLDSVPGGNREAINEALRGLQAGGSTNGGQGIGLAYAMARKNRIEGGINRVILATDGDMNVGVHSFNGLKSMVEDQRRDGISLTTLGFGQGNYNDHLMEQLADAGNGNHAYIDSLNEAGKVLGQQVTSTLLTVAKDVKTQIEFNSDHVEKYRLIGYANRILREQDFTDDSVDAGELGAGHTVTVFYELKLTDTARRRAAAGTGLPMGFQRTAAGSAKADEIAFVKLRYKKPDEDGASIEIRQPLTFGSMLPSMRAADDDMRFAAAVAGFGQILRGGAYLDGFGTDQVLDLAQSGLGADRHGHRREFLNLVRLAGGLRMPELAALGSQWHAAR